MVTGLPKYLSYYFHSLASLSSLILARPAGISHTDKLATAAAATALLVLREMGVVRVAGGDAVRRGVGGVEGRAAGVVGVE